MAVYHDVHTRGYIEPVGEEPVATERAEHHMNVAARVIYLVGGIIIGLLAVRFLLALLGANPLNGFADFVYNVSYPFAAPFFGLFSYTQHLGRSHFELGTLVAILIYALVMELLARVATIGSHRDEV
jgi:hypothetical protein